MNISVLEKIRDSAGASHADRIRATTLLVKLSGGPGEDDWKPPEESAAWAACLVDLIESQTEEVQAFVRAALAAHT